MEANKTNEVAVSDDVPVYVAAEIADNAVASPAEDTEGNADDELEDKKAA